MRRILTTNENTCFEFFVDDCPRFDENSAKYVAKNDKIIRNYPKDKSNMVGVWVRRYYSGIYELSFLNKKQRNAFSKIAYLSGEI